MNKNPGPPRGALGVYVDDNLIGVRPMPGDPAPVRVSISDIPEYFKKYKLKLIKVIKIPKQEIETLLVDNIQEIKEAPLELPKHLQDG